MSFVNTLDTYLENNPKLGALPKRQINHAKAIYETTEDIDMAKNALNKNIRESIFGEGKAKGGYVKKYAKGGGVRKAQTYG
jgi:hypothetical protein